MPEINQPVRVERRHLNALFKSLAESNHRVIGPTVREGAIVYSDLSSVDDLPQGWTEEQEAGSYRLKKRGDDALFGFTVGPHSWKQFLDPPEKRLWRAEKKGSDFAIIPEETPPEKYAFIGVRACELNAISIQDTVFLGGEIQNPLYKLKRERLFLVAVNCTQAANTCFCVSMNTGPQVENGFDLSLTEVLEKGRQHFIIEAGTAAGVRTLESIPHRKAGSGEVSAAEARVDEAASQMKRTLDTGNIRELFYENYDHPAWDKVAQRCLSCANCTMVCPTCFCSTVEDVTDVTGDHAERWQKWDSCFTLDFSYLHGGSVRSSTKSRYRQWLTHKLGTWIDQFGSSGCVGCGRCITWCPVGIDLTEEVKALRESEQTRQDP